MMWMLVAVLCMSSGSDARCERHVRPAVQSADECRDLIAPMAEYLKSVAADTGSALIFLSVQCEPGRDI